MEWQDQGVLIGVRRHGESAAIIEVFCEQHGRHFGLVQGGGSRKSAAMLQAGTQLNLSWRARLEGQLGSFNVEPTLSRGATLLADRHKLYAFNALSSLLTKLLPEREPNPQLFSHYMDLLSAMEQNACWQARYGRFELELLTVLGYGIDLSGCVVSGETVDLTHVSPKSGRAVGRVAARGWEAKLLPLPQFLLLNHSTEISAVEFFEALRLTGYFFAIRGFPSAASLPEARQRFQELVARRANELDDHPE